MILNNSKYENRIRWVIVSSPILYLIVIISLISAAYENNVIQDHLGGFFVFSAIGFVVFLRAFMCLRESAKEAEIVGEELRLLSPRYGFLILSKNHIMNILPSSLLDPIQTVKILDSVGRVHRIVEAPAIEDFLAKDLRSILLEWKANEGAVCVAKPIVSWPRKFGH
jgi:hypothetical protein